MDHCALSLKLNVASFDQPYFTFNVFLKTVLNVNFIYYSSKTLIATVNNVHIAIEEFLINLYLCSLDDITCHIQNKSDN